MVDVTKENADQLPVANKRKFIRNAFKKHNYIVVGSVLVGAFVLIAILAPILAPMNPDQVNPAARLAGIGTEGHILGTDHLGRDMLSRLIYGSQVTLLSGLAAALMAMLAGVSLGVFAAMSHKRIDNIIMRFIDVLMAFPAILLAILIVAFLGPGLKNALIAVASVNIPFYARLTRSVTLSLKEMEFIEASNAIGNRKSKTVFKHILPNISAYIVVQSMMNIGWMITETASLSFLGLGAQPPTADWGSMLGEGRSIMTIAPLTVALPGICIFLVVMGFNLLGDGLRDYLDPKLKDR
ncbi:ABC transporter permease [Virgibacillus sp. W0430]|uniref:ABC transporter permease n=1 Tax=Virgibacillus sp. W0430 TaxID=3391580 RepID=UPI003F47C716